MLKPLMTLQDVNWKYEGRDANALKNINVSVSPGEAVGLTGPSGAGKTTLLLLLAGLIPSNYEGDFSGQKTDNSNIGIVFQDPETQFVGLTVEEEIAFSLESLGWSDDKIEHRIKEVLQLVRLEGYENWSPLELSGGQKQRVAIASVLAASPKLLLLDEPTSELDPIGAREVFELLDRLKREQNMAILIASHATEELAQFCDRMLLLSAGELVYDLSTGEFFKRADELSEHGIYVPDMMRLYFWLKQAVEIDFPTTTIPLSIKEMVRMFQQLPKEKELG